MIYQKLAIKCKTQPIWILHASHPSSMNCASSLFTSTLAAHMFANIFMTSWLKTKKENAPNLQHEDPYDIDPSINLDFVLNRSQKVVWFSWQSIFFFIFLNSPQPKEYTISI